MKNGEVLLTPKELAEAIGASESSLRRWVDSGDIRMSRTAGGHRRIPLAEAIRFVRQIGARVVRPDLLGLAGSGRGDGGRLRGGDEERLFESLRAGDRQVVKGLLQSMYLDAGSLHALFDGPVRGALHRLGELWNHDERGILIEHRATEICIEAIGAMRSLLPTAGERAPLAIGAAPERDMYQLPTMMAGMVLSEAGFREINFGANTPVELLASEAVARRARLVWLSVSAPQDFKSLRASIKKAAGMLAPRGIRLILGGRHHAECASAGLENVTLVTSMAELAALAKEIKGEKAVAPR